MPLLVWLALTAGCTVGPAFQPPEPPLPAAWSGGATQPPPSPAAAAAWQNDRWWALFEDPLLSRLVDRALEAGLDVQQAAARVRQSRAALGIAAAEPGPLLDGTASYRRARSAGDESRGSLLNRFLAGFDARWEIDLFGGTRRAVEAAEADLQAAAEGLRAARLTLAAEVARTYLDLRLAQERLAIGRRNLAAQRRSAELTRRRLAAGLTDALDAAGAEGQAATTAAALPLLETAALQAVHALGLLLGREPASLLPELTPTAALPPAPPAIPTGLPSDLLRRRPDILQAEAQVHAASARIGVATADLFPRFTLGASLGYQSAESASWLDPVSRFWSWGPSLDWPLFDRGRIRANIALQQALQDERLILYRRTVLAALREVEDALAASTREQERLGSLETAVSAARRGVELATERYRAGQVDFLNVLVAQRSLLAAEEAQVQSRHTLSVQAVALCKALGGGWSEERP